MPPMLPPLPVTADPANPLGRGLYAASTLRDLDVPARLIGGVDLDPMNLATGHGQWPAECGTEPDPAPVKAGARADRDEFPATVVWAADECNLVGTPRDEAQARAVQTLRIREPIEAEIHAATVLSDKAGAAEEAADYADAVALLDAGLATRGTRGVVHAPASLAVALKRFLVERSGRWETPLGHRVAFYAAGLEDDTLYGTSAVTVYRAPTEISEGIGQTKNTRLLVVEREIVITWEGVPILVEVTE